MKAKLIKVDDGYMLYINNILYASDVNPYVKLSLKNCQAIECGYDLDELAKNIKTEDGFAHGQSFIAGFQKALELIGDKKFSEIDMNKAFRLGHSLQTDITLKNKEYKPSGHFFEELIQSLQQTKWDVDIVQEEGKDTFGNAELTWYNPKLDADGCLILKRAE